MAGIILPHRDLDTDVYTLARERIASVLDNFDHVSVSFSGGKDSTAVLNVALEVAHSDPKYDKHLPLRVVFFDEEAIPLQTADYVRRVAARDDITLEWFCLPIRHRNACSRAEPWWWPWAPEARERWCRPLPLEAITEMTGFPIQPPEARYTMPDANNLWMPPERGNCASLMGIRASESMNRRRAVSWRKHDNYIVPFRGATARGNLWTAYPIYDWHTSDVWTAPALRDWDYNTAYDVMEMAGIPHDQQRCSPAFGEEPMQRFNTYAECFPEIWSKMMDRVPGVGAAWRYARTELWGYGGVPPKPAGWSWPDYIDHYLAKFAPGDAAKVAAGIGKLIKRHYNKTSDPIVERSRHPVSGVSWQWILSMAIRGDLKGRRLSQATVAVRTDPDTSLPLPRYWHAYAAELADIIAEGRYAELAAPVAAPADPDALIPEYAKEATA